MENQSHERDQETPSPPHCQDVPLSKGLVQVRLFGHPELWRNGCLLPPLATHKSQSLLAYLILHRDRPHTRDHLATLLWGDQAERQARRSLATALWRIRRLLDDDEYLLADSTSVQFNPASSFWLDVAEFERLASIVPPSMSDLQMAAELYRGDLLEGFYDDWCIEERYCLDELYLRVMQALVAALEQSGQAKQALEWADQILARDPLREDVHRTAVRLYVQLGDRTAAIRQARSCRLIIQSELGVEPTAETMALCDGLLGASWRRRTGAHSPTISRRPQTSGRSSLVEYPPFVGREAETAALLDRWSQAQAGHGSLVCVSGEAGIGKSRLVQHVCQVVRQRGGWVVQGDCYEYERGSPHAPLVDILRSVFSLGGSSVWAGLSSWQITELLSLAPEIGEYLAIPRGRIIPVEANGVEYHAARLFNAFTSLLLEVAQQHPLLLLLEDVQWAHDSTLAWLRDCARHLPDACILLLLTRRNDEISAHHPLHNLLLWSEQKGLGARLALTRLSEQALATWMQGASLARVAQIYRQTEGNPLFVLETLRMLVEEGQIGFVQGQWIEKALPAQLPIPDSIRHLIESKHRQLTVAAARLVEAAAVIGRDFDWDILERVWGKGEEATLEALDELTRKRLVREASGAFGKDYEFDHHLVREVVYQSLHHRRRQQLHARVAEALAELHRDHTTASAEIAFHYLRAREWTKARSYLLEAGDQAGSVAADAEALSYYEQALAAPMRTSGDHWQPLQQAAVERKMGQVLFRRGQYSRALEYLHRALQDLGRPFPTARWGVRRAVVREMVRQIGLHLPQWLRRAPPPQVSAVTQEEINILRPMGWIHSLLSNQEAYLLVALTALNVSEVGGYARGIAEGAAALGIAADFLPLFPLAGQYHERALALIHQVQEPGTLGFIHMGQAYHEYLLGREETALEHAQLSAQEFERASDLHRWALLTLLTALIHDHRGALARADELARDLVRLGEQSADPQVQCYGDELYGIALRRKGRLGEAVAYLQQALAHAEQVPDQMSRVEIGGELARCHLHLGDWHQAVRTGEASRQLAVQFSVAGDSLGRLLNGLAEVYLFGAERFKDDWMPKAGQACQAAVKHGKAFRPGLPEALRLTGTYEWLRGDRAGARRRWMTSLELADELGHPYDKGLAYLEMGKRLGEPVFLQRAEASFAGIGAKSDRAEVQELLKS